MGMPSGLPCIMALVQDRPGLGGNGSSEVRVWPEGLTGYEPYPRMGDVVDELVPFRELKQAIELLGNSEIALYMREFMTIGMSTQMIVACIFSGDEACVEDAIRNHPYTDNFDTKQDAVEVTVSLELQYFAARVLGEVAGLFPSAPGLAGAEID